MNHISLKLDVTDSLPPQVCDGRRLSVAAWIFIPSLNSQRNKAPTVIALLNGGTYDKRYFDVHISGRTGYSMAEHLRDLGHVVVLLDHLGVGDSDRAPRQMLVTRHVAAAANHAALQQLYQMLREGTLDPLLRPMPSFLKIGGGHSLGAMQTITQQASHRTYDALIVLGYTAVGVHLTIDGRLVRADPGKLMDDAPDYMLRDRAALRSTFHWDDLPADVLAADDALLVEVPYVLSHQAISPGIVADDVGRIETPIFICLGERDVSPDPHAEPTYYRGSSDITLQILPRSGHCQSFAETRQLLFDRVDGWIAGLTKQTVAERTELSGIEVCSNN